MRCFAAFVAVGFICLHLATGPAAAQWNPERQYAYTRQQCAASRSAIEKDECQYNSESLIGNLRDCVREGSPYARRCAQLLPSAQGFLRRVNSSPVLQQHRAEQRGASEAAGIRSLCASQNGGYWAGSYVPCVRSYGIRP